MRDFTFHNPTRIEFGHAKENDIGEHVAAYGLERVLILYGSERVKRDGLFDRVAASLTEKGIGFEDQGGVVSNPKLALVRQTIETVKAKGLQAVVAVGGGSVVDSAKAIAAGAKYDGDVWDFFDRKAEIQSAIPVFAIMTLAATGSEMNCYAVVGNEETRQKYAIASPHIFPKVSIINAELMATVSPSYLAYSAVDIFAHCLDLYFTADYLPEFNATLIENILRVVMRTTDRLMEDPADYGARAEFAWVSTMALNGNTFVGAEGFTFDTHLIEHAMSAHFNIAHGAGLAVVLPAWMKWLETNGNPRLARLGGALFGVERADETIERLIAWFGAIGAPTSLGQAEIPRDSIDALADNAVAFAKSMGMEHAMTRDDKVAILELAA